MDIDLLKSIPEDQIEMMLMMQMDKLPEFSAAYADDDDVNNDEMAMIEAHHHHHDTHTQQGGSSINNIGAIAQILDSSNNAYPPSTATISFSTNTSPPAHYHQEASAVNFLSGKWRNDLPPPAGIVANDKRSSMAAMREMIFRIAAMQPIHIDPESVKPPKRRNVKISKDPQSVAARHRRERISERIRILQRLVPGGTKMDTASMLDEAIHYVKFLKKQVQSLERAAANRPAPPPVGGIGFPVPMSSGTYLPAAAAISTNKTYQATPHHHQNVQHFSDA